MYAFAVPCFGAHKMRMVLLLIALCLSEVASYSFIPVQYHIQTDKGPNRYFRFQTYNGQFRREKRLDGGAVVGTYGWVDANGLLRLYDYFADDKGYRVVRTRVTQTDPPKFTPVSRPHTPVRRRPAYTQSSSAFGQKTSSRPSPSHKKTPQRLRPLVVRNKVQKVSPHRHQTVSAPAFGSKISSDSSSGVSTPKRKDDGPPPGYEFDRPGGTTIINYDTGNQYRKEKKFPDGSVVGEHGYVDPMGILRKTYYRSGSRGHEEVKKSYWVGARSPES